MRSDLCAPAVRGRHAGVENLAVLVVGKADGAVVGPLPASVCHDPLFSAVRILDLQLGKQFRLGPVLVAKPPRADAAPVPAVGQLHGKGVLFFQKRRHVVGLVLYTLPVIGDPRRQRHGNAFAVEFGAVKPAGGHIQPRPLHFAVTGKRLAEVIRGIPLSPVDRVIAGYPFGAPVGRPQHAHLKKRGLAPVALFAVLVPEFYSVVDPFAGDQRQRVLRTHAVAFHPAGIPIFADDPVGSLLHAARTVPEHAGIGDIDPDGVGQVFRS